MPAWLDKALSFRYPPFDMKNAGGFGAVKPGKLIGKRGETLEDQKIGGGFSLTNVIGKALLLTAVLAGIDRASGGKLYVTQTLRDLAQRIRG